MLGTIINGIAIVIGTLVGMAFGSRFSNSLRNTVMSALGIFSSMTGIGLFLKSENSIIPLAGIVIGICLGELMKIDEGMEKFGGFLQRKFQSVSGGSDNQKRREFIDAFITSSLLYVIGPMAILGSIDDGLGNGIQLLVIKSILDGITAIAFATTMGVGIAFSAIPVMIYQGAITLLAVQAEKILTDSMVTEMSAAGGIMLVSIGLSSLLEIKKIKVSSMLPALIITPLIVWVISLF